MKLKSSNSFKLFLRILAFILCLIILTLFVFIIWTKQLVENNVLSFIKDTPQVIESTVTPFPVGVNSVSKQISENPLVDSYVESNLSLNINATRRDRLVDRILAKLVKLDWYQNLASSVSRILVIYPGDRKEEVVDNFGDILKWDKDERLLFSNYIAEAEPYLEDGKFFPGRYVVPYDATPEIVADSVYEKFSSEILARYNEEVEKIVPLKEALTIASLLEREAYDFVDMRVISGVIWNRLFIGMPLQLDATLQYARGSKVTEAKWWPITKPADKYIDSSFNTYKNVGLPPFPIANPSVEAVVAALNPRDTDCLFYFHGPKGQFYCSVTYEEHVANLKKVYGQGK